jgi:thioredoxin 1
MKLATIFAMSILSSVSLTSCWQATEKEPTPLAHVQGSNNIIYLHDVVTRNQDITATFNSYIQSGNVVVDFYADWCNPCRLMSNTIAQVASQFPSITFVKVNVDQFESVSSNIRSLPTLVFYKNGTQIKRVSGFREKNQLTSLLKEVY